MAQRGNFVGLHVVRYGVALREVRIYSWRELASDDWSRFFADWHGTVPRYSLQYDGYGDLQYWDVSALRLVKLHAKGVFVAYAWLSGSGFVDVAAWLACPPRAEGSDVATQNSVHLIKINTWLKRLHRMSQSASKKKQCQPTTQSTVPTRRYRQCFKHQRGLPIRRHPSPP